MDDDSEYKISDSHSRNDLKDDIDLSLIYISMMIMLVTILLLYCIVKNRLFPDLFQFVMADTVAADELNELSLNLSLILDKQQQNRQNGAPLSQLGSTPPPKTIPSKASITRKTTSGNSITSLTVQASSTDSISMVASKSSGIKVPLATHYEIYVLFHLFLHIVNVKSDILYLFTVPFTSFTIQFLLIIFMLPHFIFYLLPAMVDLEDEGLYTSVQNFIYNLIGAMPLMNF